MLNDPAPFLLRVTQNGDGSSWQVAPVDAPAPTQTTRQDLAVCTPVMATTGYGERAGQAPRCGPVTGPIGTVVAGGSKAALVAPMLSPCGGPKREPSRVDRTMHTLLAREDRALVAPVMAYMNHGAKQSGGVDEPMRTVVSGGGHAGLVAAFLLQYYGNGGDQKPGAPLNTVTTRDRHGLVVVKLGGEEFVIVDILFRMLKPRELAAAMGFPADYVWPATQREAVRLIGNAVSPPQAEALVRAVLPGGMAREGRAVA